MSGTAITVSAESSGTPLDVSYFSLDLTGLAAAQIAAIAAGTLPVVVDLDETGAGHAIDVTAQVAQALRAGDAYYVIGVAETPLARAARRPAPPRPDDARSARLLVAGRGLPPLADGSRLLFPLPPAPGPMRLISAAAAPAVLRLGMVDRGRGGLCVRALFLHGAHGRRPMALDDPALGEGWGTIESDDQGDRRWTGGNAAITLPTTDNAHLLEIVLQDGDTATLRHAA
jgi:hypothetical protein